VVDGVGCRGQHTTLVGALTRAQVHDWSTWSMQRALLLALSVCILAVSAWVDPPRVEVGFAVPAAFRLEPDTHHVTASPFDVANVHLEHANGSLRFSSRNRIVVAVTAVVLIVVLALTMWVLGLLRAVFHTLRAGRPFVGANATRIRRIAARALGSSSE
jgi:hypothetical protein